MGSADYFSIPIFFILFRETTEAAIIVSVLLTFLRQVLRGEEHTVLRKRLARQVWAGTALGLLISIAIGVAFIVIWNKYGRNLWASSEGIWVGCFSFVAVIMITVMGIAMLRTDQMQAKWKVKLTQAMNNNNNSNNQPSLDPTFSTTRASRLRHRYALFLLPFITVLREGLEAVVFIGGVTFTTSSKAIPIAVVTGILAGLFLGYLLFRGGNTLKLHSFFVGSTCLLLLLAAGLVSKGIAAFESDRWNKLTGAMSDDTGTYDPRVNLWALTCCDPKVVDAGGWQIFNAVLGWSNVASLGTVLGYIAYWVLVMVVLIGLKMKRRRAARMEGMLNGRGEQVLEGMEMPRLEKKDSLLVGVQEGAEEDDEEVEEGNEPYRSSLEDGKVVQRRWEEEEDVIQPARQSID